MNPITPIVLSLLLIAAPFIGFLRHSFLMQNIHTPTLLIMAINFLQRIYVWLLLLLNVTVIWAWYKSIQKPDFLGRRRYLSFMAVMAMAILNEILVRFLLAVDINHYPNYLFSRYGIMPENLRVASFANYLVLGSIVAFFATIFEAISKKKTNRNKATIISFNYITMLVVFSFSIIVFQSFYPFTSIVRLSKEYSQGYTERIGNDYVYIETMARLVPRDGFIIHPPQSKEWPLVGNQPMIRYFLYPRTLISGNLVNNQNFLNFNKLYYFVFIEKTMTSPDWPEIDSSSMQIKFDMITNIKYKKIESVGSYKGKVVYKIEFK
jgi:hypothetical protein